MRNFVRYKIYGELTKDRFKSNDKYPMLVSTEIERTKINIKIKLIVLFLTNMNIFNVHI